MSKQFITFVIFVILASCQDQGGNKNSMCTAQTVLDIDDTELIVEEEIDSDDLYTVDGQDEPVETTTEILTMDTILPSSSVIIPPLSSDSPSPPDASTTPDSSTTKPEITSNRTTRPTRVVTIIPEWKPILIIGCLLGCGLGVWLAILTHMALHCRSRKQETRSSTA